MEIIPIANELIDYKFFCFNGEVGIIYGVNGRNLGEGAQIGIYDKNFNKLNVSRDDEFTQDVALKKPENFDKMVFIAERIAQHFPHVRVDLYNISGKIYFGELTFYDGSGYMSFTPDSFDEQLGKMWDFPKIIHKNEKNIYSCK